MKLYVTRDWLSLSLSLQALSNALRTFFFFFMVADWYLGRRKKGREKVTGYFRNFTGIVISNGHVLRLFSDYLDMTLSSPT